MTAPRTLDERVALLMQGTDYGDDGLRQAMADELRQRLGLADKENRPLRVYAGFDPRTSDLHLGHMVPIRKLGQFQRLGHDVTFLVGRYTALIGDPSDKDKLRPRITPEEAAHNAETYSEQAFRSKLLDPAATTIDFNDRWLSKLDFAELIEIASNFTVQQFLTRETFRKRFDDGDALFVHEFFYALMQAYDAYHLRADVQVGGSDQLFNIITAARKLMEAKGVPPNIGIVLGILPGTDGEIKMSKSLGNHIPLLSAPADMFGKVMSVPDKAMPAYFRLTTRWGPDEIAAVETGLLSGEVHPRDAKMRLAAEIVATYYGPNQAAQAQAEFERVFQQGALPADMDEYQVKPGVTLVDLLAESGLAASKSQGRRLIDQGGVRLDGQTLDDPAWQVSLTQASVLQVGKRRFLRLLPGNHEDAKGTKGEEPVGS